MSASITLSRVSYSAPDGRQVLCDLDLSFGAERAGLVGRNGVGKTTILHLLTGELQPRSGAVSVRGRVAMLPQGVRDRPGETIADVFAASAALSLLERANRGVATLEEIARADWTLPVRIAAALQSVGLDAEPDTSLSALSGGQRTRANLASVVFQEPDFILLDEPTNNLDREGRAVVRDLLAGWRAGAVVVSHDRELLEAMDSIVDLTTLGATRYGGGWSCYRQRKALDLAAARHDLSEAEKRLAEIARDAQTTAERKARKDGAGKRKAAKGDMPRISIGTMKNRSEGTSGENARLAERRRNTALDEAAAARARIEVLQPLSARVPSTNLPAGRTVLTLDSVSAGYRPGAPVLRDLSLTITGPERVAVSGPNGCGKTTLLALIAGRLKPWRGTVRVGVEFALLDQHMALLDPALSILDNFARLNPHADDNARRAALARFMFRADDALQRVATLSGGQMLRAGLACVLGRAPLPSLLILDEPTNHLDLDAIEAVEAGLRGFDGALLIVSHDEAFIDAVGVSRRLTLPAPT